MGQIKNIKLHIVTDIKGTYPVVRQTSQTSWPLKLFVMRFWTQRR